MKTVTSTFVHDHVAQVWAMAEEEPVVVEVYGKRRAVVVSGAEYDRLTASRKSRKPGFAKHLFEGIDIDELLQTPIPGLEQYMP